MITYKGCKIFRCRTTTPPGMWVWEEALYGGESEDAFDSLQEAQDDIDRWFGSGPVPRVINGEIFA